MLLLSAACGLTQDWPQWAGPSRDGKASGFNAPEKWPSALAEKWRKTVGLGDATPALVSDRLYVFTREGSEEVVRCLNTNDGKEVWQKRYAAAAVTGPAAAYQGPRSSPAVAERKVVTLGVGGILVCRDAITGRQLWRKDEFSQKLPLFFTAMSPLLTDGMCIAHLGAKNDGRVMAFDLATGQPKWQWTGDGPAYSSPVLMKVAQTRQVIVQTEQNVVGLALADGKFLWQVPTPPQSGYWNSASPVVDGQTLIVTGQGTGTKAVSIIKRGDVFAAEELWHNAKLGTVYNTPVLKDGLLYALSDRGHFFCLDARTGEPAWIDPQRHSNFGAVMDAGSILLALPEKSGLIAFKPGTQRYEERARIKVSDTSIYAFPVAAGNRIFVKDKETVALWAIE